MEKTKKITTIGGQALIEGIMMVGPKRTTAAFCDEKGNVTTEDITAPRLRDKWPILGKPFIRGIFSLVDTFRLGYKALSISADKLTEEDGEEELSGLDKWLYDHLGEKLTGAVMAIGGVLAVALAILLYIILPTVLFNLLQKAFPGALSLRASCALPSLWGTSCWCPCCQTCAAPSSIMGRNIKPSSAMKTICP